MFEYVSNARSGGILTCCIPDMPVGFRIVFATRLAFEKDSPRFANYGFYGLPGAVKDRRRLCDILDLPFESLTFGEQMHTNNTRKVDEDIAGSGRVELEDRIPATDALITDLPGVPLAVLTADCVPVMLADPSTGAVAAIHAGWRGTASGILENSIRMLSDAYSTSAANLMAFIGPSIGPCCYEVKQDLMDDLSENDREFISQHAGSLFLDLQKWNRHRLAGCGILDANIHIIDVCTRCNTELFFSHRGDLIRRGSNVSLIMQCE